MLNEVLDILKHAVMITGFVFVMMLVIEYINVQTKGLWQNLVSKNQWKQYLFAAVLGAIPGCLGAFTAVALFSHRLLSFGALVTAMIATSGDEAFVMFAMFPGKALLISIVILAVGLIAGYLTDKFYKPSNILSKFSDHKLPLHEEDDCKCFVKTKFISQLTHPSRYRLLLILLVGVLFAAIAFGFIAINAKLWIKISLLLTVGFSLFIVSSVPEHFLKKHLWEHIVKMHLPRIFYWTFGTLLFVGVLMHFVNVEDLLSENMLIVLLVAVLVGIIPESGPHLVFVTLFAQGSIPFSILLASSIAQDGHGMLPLLAETKTGFFAVKLINIFFALIVGLIAFFIGF
ncbi:MAG: putative manganese transporter [Bacteroidota bacterium]